MGIKKEIKTYVQQVKDSLDYIVDTAKEGYGSQQSHWLNIKQSYGIKDAMTSHRDQILSQNNQTHQTGALPLEVRNVLKAFKSRTRRELKEKYAKVETLNDIGKAVDLEQRLDTVKTLLEKVTENYTVKYIKSIRPPLTSMSIFANALGTTKGFEKEKSHAITRKCHTCGAGRPAGTDLSTCDYCGGSFV